MSVVVDTNVAMVSSRHHPNADERCVAACIKRLCDVQQSGGLLVDDKGLILDEYLKNLGHSGQPGAGEAFAKWAFTNQAIPARVRQVPIIPRADGRWRRFDEFPDEPRLSAFDKSDQKFVAVARASGENPPISIAIDRGWWNHRVALNDAGISIDFLCPQHAPAGMLTLS